MIEVDSSKDTALLHLKEGKTCEEVSNLLGLPFNLIKEWEKEKNEPKVITADILPSYDVYLAADDDTPIDQKIKLIDKCIVESALRLAETTTQFQGQPNIARSFESTARALKGLKELLKEYDNNNVKGLEEFFEPKKDEDES